MARPLHAELSHDTFSALSVKRELDLRQRSKRVAFAYCLCALCIAAASTLQNGFPAATLAAAAVMFVIACGRYFSIVRMEVSLPAHQERWRFWVRFWIYLAALAWSAYCFLTIYDQPLGIPPLLMLIATAGFCGGATNTLAPDFKLLRNYLAILLLPSASAVGLLGGVEAISLATMIVLYFAMMLWIGSQHADWYFEAIAENARLKQAREEAESGTNAKAAFLATMSHEIRTPLSGVIGMTEMLLETPLDGGQREMAETINRSAQSLLHILNEVLDFSKIHAGKMAVRKKEFDLRRMVEDVLDLFAPLAFGKGLELYCDLPVLPPHRFLGDEGRIRQILSNLIGNAIEFTHRGEIGLKVETVTIQDSPPVARVRFILSDSGIGISSEESNKLFQPFTQAGSPASRKYGGTGLGLAISRQLAELMGGTIGLESTPGAGSTFSLDLPLPYLPEAPAAPLHFAPQRILVVSTVHLMRKSICKYIRALGLDAVETDTCDDARERLLEAHAEGREFGHLILDGGFPKHEIAAMAAIVRIHPQLIPLQIALLTTLDAELDNGGMGGVKKLRKPVRLEQLQSLFVTNAPLERGPHDAGRSQRAARHPDLQGRGRVLIAEDNAVNQRVSARLVERCGFSADVVSNGAEAVEAVRNRRYDLILMDCQMPGMDGWTAAKQIRAMDGPASQTPIIALTANAMGDDRERCLAVGMDEYLSKPVKLEDLQAAISKVSLPSS